MSTRSPAARNVMKNFHVMLERDLPNNTGKTKTLKDPRPLIVIVIIITIIIINNNSNNKFETFILSLGSSLFKTRGIICYIGSLQFLHRAASLSSFY